MFADQQDDEEVAEVMGSRRAPNITYKIKIIVSFFQIATNMPFILDVDWPSHFQTFISWL